MSLAAIAERASHAPSASLIGGIFAEGRRRQPVLWGLAIALLLAMVPTAAAYLLDARTVNDINVWGKPLKFELSLVLFVGTLAWFWGYLSAEGRQSRFLNGYALLTAAIIVFEIAYIIVQSARGVGSHFNTATPVEGILFTLMGLGALTFTAMAPILGVAIARFPRSDLAPAFRLSVVLGLILTFVLGAGAGIAISVNGGHWVAAPHTDAGGFPIFGWTRQGGDLRVAHFLGIHAMQILPVIGWFIARRAPGAGGAIWIAAGLFSLTTAYTLAEALAGRPFLAFPG